MPRLKPKNLYLEQIQENLHSHICANHPWLKTKLHYNNLCVPKFFSCGEGKIVSPDQKGCADKNECLDRPCLNGGTCINQEPKLRYRCLCPEGYWGENCELVQEGQTLKLSMGALAAILVCLLIILSKFSQVNHDGMHRQLSFSGSCAWKVLYS